MLLLWMVLGGLEFSGIEASTAGCGLPNNWTMPWVQQQWQIKAYRFYRDPLPKMEYSLWSLYQTIPIHYMVFTTYAIDLSIFKMFFLKKLFCRSIHFTLTQLFRVIFSQRFLSLTPKPLFRAPLLQPWQTT